MLGFDQIHSEIAQHSWDTMDPTGSYLFFDESEIHTQSSEAPALAWDFKSPVDGHGSN